MIHHWSDRFSTIQRLWFYRIETLLALALITHFAVVWAVPRLIMWRLTSVSASQAQAAGAVFFPPVTDHTQRRVVMPSPDLLYATCSYDLSVKPLRVRANPKTPHYWSIALYASNSDNFYVINDQQLGGKPLDLVLLGPSSYPAAPPIAAGMQAVTAPSTKGLLLMRILVADARSELPQMELARRSLQCEEF